MYPDDLVCQYRNTYVIREAKILGDTPKYLESFWWYDDGMWGEIEVKYVMWVTSKKKV